MEFYPADAMEILLGILASIAVLPIFGLIAFVQFRLLLLWQPLFAFTLMKVITKLLVLGPPVIFLGASVRFFGSKAGWFVPEVPPTVAELVWVPLWSFAAIWLLRLAATRAAENMN